MLFPPLALPLPPPPPRLTVSQSVAIHIRNATKSLENKPFAGQSAIDFYNDMQESCPV